MHHAIPERHDGIGSVMHHNPLQCCTFLRPVSCLLIDSGKQGQSAWQGVQGVSGHDADPCNA